MNKLEFDTYSQRYITTIELNSKHGYREITFSGKHFF
jgi:hypothetical protein